MRGQGEEKRSLAPTDREPTMKFGSQNMFLLIKCTNLNLDPREIFTDTEPSLTTDHLRLEGHSCFIILVSEGGWSGDLELEILSRYGPWANRDTH